jgi:hypothetical protein
MIRKISSATGGAEGPGALQGIRSAMVQVVAATMVEAWRAALRRSRVPAVSQQHFPAPRDRRPPYADETMKPTSESLSPSEDTL